MGAELGGVHARPEAWCGRWSVDDPTSIDEEIDAVHRGIVDEELHGVGDVRGHHVATRQRALAAVLEEVVLAQPVG